MDYSKTLQLPKTDFPMRASLPKREPEILAKWDEENIYEKVQKKNQGKDKFILHDGPPYANGNIHLGTALNKTLKDIVVKFKSMDGFDAPYVPGWDTHGLPIEHAVIKTTGANPKELGAVDFRKKCRDYALKYRDIQKEEFRRLGVRGDWENPYMTLHPEFEAKQVEVFGEMAKKGYIYKGLKPVYWCSSCETALAEAEVEYTERRSPSIFVRFPLYEGTKLTDRELPVSVVIWTTTPWTLPGNVAITVHPEHSYVLLQAGEELLILAEELVSAVMKQLQIDDYEIIKTMSGKELDGLKAMHPFADRDSLLIMGEHVTLDQGTGCVHTAPGHGLEDYDMGIRYSLPMIQPLDSKGRFTSEGGQFEGLHYDKANKEITKELDERGMLMDLSFIDHQYPNCWRCKEPVIYRATEQWFASVKGFRKEALETIDEVQWIPRWGKERIRSMVADRLDWCISRQRIWGVPIPIFYCRDCGQELINDESIEAVKEMFLKEGSDSWFTRKAEEILPAGMGCNECGSTNFRKETDIMDVWFDSGSSHAAVLETYKELRWPADLYLEGSDQHRGWFQSSLLTSVATRGRAPYEAVLTHGFVVDGEGRKMSKSLGNVIYPQEVLKNNGADILRLWVASSDFKGDINVSENILKQMVEVYRKIRNTARFILGNLADFDPNTDKVPYDEYTEIDKWALHRLHSLIDKVTEAYRSYDYHVIYHSVHNFCVVDMSSFYLDVLKDRLYAEPAEDPHRRASQTVMYEIIQALVKLMAPVLTFTAEEIWSYMPKEEDMPSSVQLTEWPETNKEHIDHKLAQKWKRLMEAREVVSHALELARKEKIIGQSLQADVDLYADKNWLSLLEPYKDWLSTVFIVSNVRLLSSEKAPVEAVKEEGVEGLSAVVRHSEGDKCERCWNFREDVGEYDDHPTLCGRCYQVIQSQ